MPLGYDEFRAIKCDEEVGEPLERSSSIPHVPAASFDFEYESFYRELASGAWHWFEGITHYAKNAAAKVTTRKGERYLHFVTPQGRGEFFPVSRWLNKLRDIASRPDPLPHALILPRIWTPRVQLEQSIVLASTVPALLVAIQEEKRPLREIPWRQLEEIVAELLRSRGLEVILTPRSRDGGRDIVARGELIPGEPSLLAVEVKQTAVVGIAALQRALQANEDFPGLLLATAGRFSAGVIREKERNRNRLRLVLKDGIALRQWIDAYGLTRTMGE